MPMSLPAAPATAAATSPSAAVTATTVTTAAPPSLTSTWTVHVVSGGRVSVAWWSAAFELFLQGLVGLAHLSVAEMHLAVEMVR